MKVSVIRYGLKIEPKSAVSKQKCIDHIEEKWQLNFMAIFLYSVYIFVWIQHDCLANVVFLLRIPAVRFI